MHISIEEHWTRYIQKTLSIYLTLKLTKKFAYQNLQNLTNLNWTLDVSVHEHLQKLDKEIDLVVVSEYFPQSLILLKRMSGLDFSDIVYIPSNVKKPLHNRHKITPEHRTKIRWVWKQNFQWKSLASYVVGTPFLL